MMDDADAEDERTSGSRAHATTRRTRGLSK